MKVLKNVLFQPLLLLVCFLFLNFQVKADAMRGNQAAGSQQTHIKKGELLESKGIIEPAIELVNGNNFQQNSSFFKKNSSPQAHLSLQTALIARFYTLRGDCFHYILSIPIYLFNRSIRI